MRAARWVLGIIWLVCVSSPAECQDSSSVLARQLDGVRAATARYRDLEAAKRDGYTRAAVGGMDAALMGEHWVNRELLKQPIDLQRPAVLQYIQVGEKRVLVGVAYGEWERPGDPLPEGFAGDSDHWHSHDMPELAQRLANTRGPLMRWVIARRVSSDRAFGGDGRTQLAMLHVWLWSNNPDGIFANFNPALPYVRAGLPDFWAEAGNLAAARGIALLGDDACNVSVARLSRVVEADTKQESEITRACSDARGRILAARQDGAESADLNLTSADAWNGFQKAVATVLTPQQRQALADLGGKDMMGMNHGHEGR
jgi:hypothetical protein